MSQQKKLAQLKAGLGKVKTGSFDFNRIERFFLLSDKSQFHQVISDRTFQDLDMEELFMLADRTISKVGQQYLYQVLRTIPENKNRAERFEKIIEILKADPACRDQVLLEIATLNKKEAYYISSLFLEKHIEKPKWFWIVPVLSCLSICTVLVSFILPKFLIFLVLLLAVNFGIHYWNKINLYKYSGSIPELLKLSQAAKNISALDGLKDLYPDGAEPAQVLSGLGIQMSIFKLEVKLQSEIGQAVEYFVELIKALFLIEPLVLYHVLEKLDQKRPQIQKLYQYIGEIDTAISISLLREDVPYFCLPTIIPPEKKLKAAEIYHPLIYQSISNSIDLDEKSALLTGSNMSGKTTFIRTVGLNVITAQTLNTCFATTFVTPVLKVHSAIRIADDLLSNKSYYFEEVLTIKSLLEESRAGFQHLFLLDEMFKGTNTVERIASGKAVLTFLDQGQNLALAATHDLELAALLKDNFSLFHFTEIFKDNGFEFDYRLKPGNLTDTNAIRILQLNGYPEEVIREATESANRLYQTRQMTNCK